MKKNFCCRSKERKKVNISKLTRYTKRFVIFKDYLFLFLHVRMFPACCFRQRTYVAKGYVNGVPNETQTHLCRFIRRFVQVLLWGLYSGHCGMWDFFSSNLLPFPERVFSSVFTPNQFLICYKVFHCFTLDHCACVCCVLSGFENPQTVNFSSHSVCISSCVCLQSGLDCFCVGYSFAWLTDLANK